jgi:hypothetical protein
LVVFQAVKKAWKVAFQIFELLSWKTTSLVCQAGRLSAWKIMTKLEDYLPALKATKLEGSLPNELGDLPF